MRKNVLFNILFFINSLFMFSFSLVGFSSVTKTRQESEAWAICETHAHRKKTDFVLTARDEKYPTTTNSLRNALNSTLTVSNADGQVPYMCAAPYDDLVPISYSNGTDNISIPGIAMNYCHGNDELYLNYLGLSSINKINLKSSEMLANQIYLSYDLAQLISNDLIFDDINELVNSDVSFNVIIDGSIQTMSFTVVDIIKKGSNSMSNIYGKYFIVGGYRFVNVSKIQGFELHAIMPNDFYSNRHWLRVYYGVVEKIFGYQSKYVSFANPNALPKSTSNLIIVDSQKNIRNIILSLSLMTILIFTEAILIIKCHKLNKIRFQKLEPVYLFFALSLATLIISRSRLVTYGLGVGCIFNALGLLITTSLLIFIASLYILFIPDENRKSLKKNKTNKTESE